MLLVSTSEEGLCEGMETFGQRHFGELPRESTFILSIDTVGSPHLCVLRGEGMRGMREYPRRSLELIDGLAEELGIHLFPSLRLRNATDGSIALAGGYECASLASCTDLKQPANYHWPTDVPENVDYATRRRRGSPDRGRRAPPRRALARLSQSATPGDSRFRSGPGGVLHRAMYERLLILEPDRAQVKRLGEAWVTIANIVGLTVGLVIAIALIVALGA